MPQQWQYLFVKVNEDARSVNNWYIIEVNGTDMGGGNLFGSKGPSFVDYSQQLGLEGWELVAVSTTHVYAYKRPLQRP